MEAFKNQLKDYRRGIFPRSSMEVVFRLWYGWNKDKKNSMMTTQTLAFDGGTAQLKWWKQAGTIIVKTIALDEGLRGKGAFTSTAVKMLDWPGVLDVEMESVGSDELVAKLLATGSWKKKPWCDSNLLATK